MRTDRYPSVPGSYAHAPETSREAAESVADVAGSIRARVHGVIEQAGVNGVIADDVAAALDLNVYQVRARISELHASKAIVDSGRRSKGISGRRAAVWVAKQFAPKPAADDPQLSFLDAA